METLEQLFEETLRDIYYAEKAILKALPKMAKKASSEALASASRSTSTRPKARSSASKGSST